MPKSFAGLSTIRRQCVPSRCMRCSGPIALCKPSSARSLAAAELQAEMVLQMIQMTRVMRVKKTNSAVIALARGLVHITFAACSSCVQFTSVYGLPFQIVRSQ